LESAAGCTSGPLAGAEAGEDDGEGAGEDFQVEQRDQLSMYWRSSCNPLIEAIWCGR